MYCEQEEGLESKEEFEMWRVVFWTGIVGKGGKESFYKEHKFIILKLEKKIEIRRKRK